MSYRDEKKDKLDQFLLWLEQDRNNPGLLTDTVDAAIAANAFDRAEELLKEFSEQHALTPELLNLRGVIFLRKGDFLQSIEVFDKLIQQGHDAISVRFNLAWSYALADDRVKALSFLDDEMTQELPQAAALCVQMLHSSGQFEEAMDQARELAEVHPNDPGLMATMSVLALDLENPELAKTCAEKAGSHPDALTTLGTLDLGEHRVEEAHQRFSAALQVNDKNARAWVGQGLAYLSGGEKEKALGDLDKGAELFGSHIGSWIAAGWAHFMNDDRKTSRQRFQTALDLDGSFAESHGSLAVLDAVDGDIENAEKSCEIALRLDRQCFSAALAKSLILQAQGDADKAERIVELALNTPIGGNGETLMDSLIPMSGGVAKNPTTVH